MPKVLIAIILTIFRPVLCKLPQKEYVLKVEKTLTLKRKNDEEIKI